MSTSSSSDASASRIQQLETEIAEYKKKHSDWENVDFKSNRVTTMETNLITLQTQGKFPPFIVSI